MSDQATLTAIVGGTILDGNGGPPLEQGVILIEGKRIKAIGDRHTPLPPQASVIAAAGKYVMPGMMDANVHLMAAVRMEDLVRHEDRYELLIAEAAQIALRSGLTTVFDTWGPRQPLINVRERINAGELPGSRVFCAGNIIGLDGPFSEDFFPRTLAVASPALVERINWMWAENVGSRLTWMTPEEVARAVRDYIRGGVDFVKYASSEHRTAVGPSAYLAFSHHAQRALIEEAHRAGLTAQAHATSVEALRAAAEAGCDLVQHANLTGPIPIPDATLELLVGRRTACTLFPLTQRRYQWLVENGDVTGFFTDVTVNTNVTKLIGSGVTLLLATDAGVMAAEATTDPSWAVAAAGEDNLFELGRGHFHWLKAMEEQGLAPMAGLMAATRNIAVAYGKDGELGTLEPGKIADVLILDENPLESADNYRTLWMVLKDGAVVDRSALPAKPILTKAQAPAHAGGVPSCCRRVNAELTSEGVSNFRVNVTV
jgi:imidazolonepropionase-like amidohydrolase